MSMNLSSLFLILLPVVLALEWPPDAEICQDVVCKKPKGSWCTPGEKNGKLKAVCECPENCPDVYQPVCSVYGRQYENLCKLHEYTCKKGKNIPMAYNGICIASQKKCKDDEFQQFPVRLLDWFLHLHEIDEFGRLDPNTNIKQKTPQERSMYATWKFNQLDDDGDGKLDKKDLLNFRYSLMPLEHCASDFFKTCANKKAKKITLEGWLECLKVYDTLEYPQPEEGVTEEVDEDLDDDIDDFFGDDDDEE
ncbi:SPARC-like [Apostichopus japonicus]|uniref:SPARC-like n=1 Tax=Stichopus japonicus TaxID=307972 RepID=UPI003AB37767